MTKVWQNPWASVIFRSAELVDLEVSLARRLRPFFSGGLGAASSDGSRLLTPCGSSVVLVEGGVEAGRLGDEEEGASEVHLPPFIFPFIFSSSR